MTDQTLDCRGMNCPMPIVAMTRTVKTMESGQKLEVLATDLAFRMDLEAWSRRTGHQVESFDDGEVQRAVVVIS
ncbi:MAG: sulfurtransferase TusA family protein [Planctomycetaceae bacterium]|nr:sulfurtransferase TusA family protein [Planctomycetaceae bacterium]